eukprot:gene23672-29915_t
MSSSLGSAGGFNGGGKGYSAPGGGGATDVRYPVDAIANRILVAGGGGGPYDACGPSNGGNGGNPIGADGLPGACGGGHGGGGGTQSGGGSSNVAGNEGGSFYGGTALPNSGGGAGGGGGYFGGGAGQGGGGGGGGSSYSLGTSGVVYNATGSRGNGYLQIYYTQITASPTPSPTNPTSQPTTHFHAQQTASGATHLAADLLALTIPQRMSVGSA